MTPQLGHRLVGGHHQLHPRALGVDHPCPRGGVSGSARAVDGAVLGVGDIAHQAQGLGTGAAPCQRRLAPAGVVGQGLARVVAGAGNDGLAVVVDRVGSHHPHPRHANLRLQSCSRLPWQVIRYRRAWEEAIRRFLVIGV
jgi:hypothetical protein